MVLDGASNGDRLRRRPRAGRRAVSISFGRALYGMTATEAAVAGLISKGTGVKAAARKLGIAPSTVRTHLHRVFEKTETRRQAELAHLVNQVASRSGTLIK